MSPAGPDADSATVTKPSARCYRVVICARIDARREEAEAFVLLVDRDARALAAAAEECISYMVYLQKALTAPARADRPVADAGRRSEVTALIARVRAKLS